MKHILHYININKFTTAGFLNFPTMAWIILNLQKTRLHKSPTPKKIYSRGLVCPQTATSLTTKTPTKKNDARHFFATQFCFFFLQPPSNFLELRALSQHGTSSTFIWYTTWRSSRLSRLSTRRCWCKGVRPHGRCNARIGIIPWWHHPHPTKNA